MNTKQITRLIVALILVAVVGWLLVSKDNQSWNQGEASIGGAIMPELSINDIQKMHLENNCLEKVLNTYEIVMENRRLL